MKFMSIGDFTFSMLTEKEKQLPFYLVGSGVDFHQELDPHSRPSGHPHYQWIQVKQGSGTFVVDGETHIVGTNQGILLFPDVPHEYFAEESPWIVNWFTFNGTSLESFLQQINIESSGVYSIAQTGFFQSLIKKSLELLRSTKPSRTIEASLLVYEFLVGFSQYAHREGVDKTLKLYSRLNPVLQYIDLHYSESMSIESISEVIGVTPQYLCQLFKKILNQRPIEYLNNVRINKSKDILLKNPHIKVEEVAERTGYESSSYFCSIFKKTEGMSPGNFRELHLHKKYL